MKPTNRCLISRFHSLKTPARRAAEAVERQLANPVRVAAWNRLRWTEPGRGLEPALADLRLALRLVTLRLVALRLVLRGRAPRP